MLFFFFTFEERKDNNGTRRSLGHQGVTTQHSNWARNWISMKFICHASCIWMPNEIFKSRDVAKWRCHNTLRARLMFIRGNVAKTALSYRILSVTKFKQNLWNVWIEKLVSESKCDPKNQDGLARHWKICISTK